MDIQKQIEQLITTHPIVLFMKGSAQFPLCGFSGKAVQILQACGARHFHCVDVLQDSAIREGIKTFSNWPTIPQLYINKEFIGGSDILTEMFESGELQNLLSRSHTATA